jgi:CPA2 family monovalent cation:H+ antiporter-2
MDPTTDLVDFLIQDLAVVLLAAGLSGWLCKRLGISVIVGYLAAGIIVGTPQITFPYVTDMVRIQLLSQLGLVFLMFFIGMGLRVRKLREVGLGVMLATVVTALGTLTLARASALLLGYNPATSLFLAAMLMGSSSAIVGKLIYDNHLMHRRAGQLALAMTLLEDIVAIVMLGYLGSYVAMEQVSDNGVGEIFTMVALLVAFVALIILPGIVVLPRWLDRFEKRGGIELETLVVAGLLFAFSWLTLSAGYSIALGAFLCGVILAETKRVQAIERAFSGLKDIFVALFFTAIGMAIDVTRFPEALGVIALGVALAFIVRPIAATLGFLSVCEDEEVAMKAAFCITPIGEFSFVIAGLGVASGVLNETMQVAAVGISFVTSLLAPMAVKKSDLWVRLFRPSRISWVGTWLTTYQASWAKVMRSSDRSVLWRLLRPRLWQVGAEWLLVTAVLLFARPLQAKFTEWAQTSLHWLPMSELVYWLAISLLILGPIIALYRNISAMAMLLADYIATKLKKQPESLSRIEVVFRWAGLISLSLWLVNLLPIGSIDAGEWVILLVVLGITLSYGWRNWVRWHSHAEHSIKSAFAEELKPESPVAKLSKKVNEELGLNILEVEVPVRAGIIGQTMGELNLRRLFDVSVVSIDRQGHSLKKISASEALYAGDRLYLVGSAENLEKAVELITAPSDSDESTNTNLSTAILTKLIIAESSPWAGRSLSELNWPARFGIQVVGIRRGDKLQVSFSANDQLQVDDELTLAGPLNAIEALLDAGTKSENSETAADLNDPLGPQR